MSKETEEIISICEALPENKVAEVADFARFLLAREDDSRWDSLIDHPSKRPRLDAFLKESAAEPAAPLDADQL